MPVQVNILEAKNRLSQLIKAAQRGEDVVIANRGEPVARLVPADSADARSERNFLAWLERHPLPMHAQRSHADIEAGIQAERDAWD